ncbi:hypothetical protein [Rubinisphaera margarita]|uniref:hypothetical protein n=1 Tax=Rubinisphaera margarita TaxID=2909586 RepID=UPI001EE91222|nr:hypothetical protein [Rubinisphaera margarita]MCG6156153.1 hypothetical protein [Rubinisphaera margarita]
MIERSAEEKRDYVTSILTADRIDCRKVVKQRQVFLNEGTPASTPVVPAQFSVQRARQAEATLSTVRRSMTETEQEETQESNRQERNTRWVLFFVIIPAFSLLRYALSDRNSPEPVQPAVSYRNSQFMPNELDLQEFSPNVSSRMRRSALEVNPDGKPAIPVRAVTRQILSQALPTPSPTDKRYAAVRHVRNDPAAAGALAEIDSEFREYQKSLEWEADHGFLREDDLKEYHARVMLYLETVYQLAIQHGHAPADAAEALPVPVPSSEDSDE